FRRTWTIRCFNSGNRSRTIARKTLPTKPVPPSKSIVECRKDSIAEISPVPVLGGCSPASYSPRTGFHRQGLRAFIRVLLRPSEMEERSTRIPEVRESASLAVERCVEAPKMDLSRRDGLLQRAWERRPHCRKRRTILPDRCLPFAHTPE